MNMPQIRKIIYFCILSQKRDLSLLFKYLVSQSLIKIIIWKFRETFDSFLMSFIEMESNKTSFKGCKKIQQDPKFSWEKSFSIQIEFTMFTIEVYLTKSFKFFGLLFLDSLSIEFQCYYLFAQSKMKIAME